MREVWEIGAAVPKQKLKGGKMRRWMKDGCREGTRVAAPSGYNGDAVKSMGSPLEIVQNIPLGNNWVEIHFCG